MTSKILEQYLPLDLVKLVLEYYDLKPLVKSITSDFLMVRFPSDMNKIFNLDCIVEDALPMFQIVIDHIVEKYDLDGDTGPCDCSDDFCLHWSNVWIDVFNYLEHDINIPNSFRADDLYPILKEIFSKFAGDNNGYYPFENKCDHAILKAIASFALGM